MPRTKGGIKSHRRHKSVLAITKGQRMSRHRLFKRASEARLKSLAYSFRDRRARKADMRKLWILRINAAARLNGMSYNSFISGLKAAGVTLDRKVLADLAVHDSGAFAKLAEQVKGS